MEHTTYSCTRKLDNKISDVLYLSFTGKISGFAVPDFEKTLLENLESGLFATVILECGDVSYITSAGLRSLLKALKIANARKIKIICRCLPDSFLWTIIVQVGFHNYMDRWDPEKK